MLYLGRVIVIRSGITRSVRNDTSFMSNNDHTEVVRLVTQLVKSNAVIVLAVLPTEPRKTSSDGLSQDAFNECYSLLTDLLNARDELDQDVVWDDAVIKTAVHNIYKANMSVVVMSRFDALMPCAAMPTAPMQFDMSAV